MRRLSETILIVDLYSDIYRQSYAQGSLENWGDTVGELKSAEMRVSRMPSWKAKTLGKLMQEKVLLER
jgi:hypothetical protein